MKCLTCQTEMEICNQLKHPTFRIDYIQCPTCNSKGKITMNKKEQVEGLQWSKAEKEVFYEV